MAAYVIADIEVTDQVGYEEYRRLAGPALEAYGGRFLVRGGAIETLEGTWQPRRLILLEFESVDQARQWYHSPEYQEAKTIRERTARSNLVIVEGLPA
jgi:uncharacterized protein (DUF1330 family)